MIDIDHSHPAAQDILRIEEQYLAGLLSREEAKQATVAAIRDPRGRGTVSQPGRIPRGASRRAHCPTTQTIGGGPMNLYANSGDRTIIDDNGREYTPNEARAEIQAGRVDDMNQSLARLLNHYNGDWSALIAFYDECDRSK